MSARILLIPRDCNMAADGIAALRAAGVVAVECDNPENIVEVAPVGPLEIMYRAALEAVRDTSDFNEVKRDYFKRVEKALVMLSKEAQNA